MHHWLKMHYRNSLDSLQDLLARPLSTVLTAAVIAIALAMPASLNLLVKNGRSLAGELDSARDFSVYLQVGLSLERAQEIAAEIRTMTGVAAVSLTTADDALEEATGTG